jgi:hypothetical protein
LLPAAPHPETNQQLGPILDETLGAINWMQHSQPLITNAISPSLLLLLLLLPICTASLLPQHSEPACSYWLDHRSELLQVTMQRKIHCQCQAITSVVMHLSATHL